MQFGEICCENASRSSNFYHFRSAKRSFKIIEFDLQIVVNL